jgi:hypothetical protein
MSDELPGPHHCIGVTRTVTDVVFRGLRAKCAAGGGILSLEDLDSFHSKIIESFSSGFDLFERRHHLCMDVSLGKASMPFARSKILSTLLRACGEKSAHGAFSFQVERLGLEWIDQLFGSLAHYIHQRVHTDIDARLITAYVDTATMPKTTLTITELLKQEPVQCILLDSIGAAFEVPGAPESIAKDVCDSVNNFIAGERGIGGPHVCKVTEDQICRFLALLPRQLRAMVNAMRAIEPFAEHPISVD